MNCFQSNQIVTYLKQFTHNVGNYLGTLATLRAAKDEILLVQLQAEAAKPAPGWEGSDRICPCQLTHAVERLGLYWNTSSLYQIAWLVW